MINKMAPLGTTGYLLHKVILPRLSEGLIQRNKYGKPVIWDDQEICPKLKKRERKKKS